MPEGTSVPELKPLVLPAQVNRTWIAPDGTEIPIGAFGTHATASKKLGAVGDDSERVGEMLKRGYVRKAHVGEYAIGIITPRTLEIVDEAAKRDARYMIARGRGGDSPTIHLDIRGRLIELSPYADQRAVQLKTLLDDAESNSNTDGAVEGCEKTTAVA